ncbi:Fic family protein [Aquabacterium sp. CECT 9606]|uniref:Fic/DOC family protein n=1 Tax=Aquabacterium sp. CECT 9606 TaxID=2845822 RepID=UPI001E528E1C|nr:Fic family protein [Aquabacterium sp. CECT 9606]CAH0356034.1 Protein adenylyltransferase VbhT [Aquabacterium sp. CECT 9606]
MNPYIDPTTGAHYNKLGIRDRDDLREVEYAVTDLRIAELRVNPIQGKFDLDHLKKVHEHIFQDLYEWAGKERTVNFSKRDAEEPEWASHFAQARKIKDVSDSINDDLKAWNYLKGMNQSDFTAAITAVYVKVNYMHPFPEGNGRSTQTFMSQLAREAGYELKYDKVDKDDWNHAAARSMPQKNRADPDMTRKADVSLIQDVFKQIVEPIRDRDKAQPGRER